MTEPIRIQFEITDSQHELLLYYVSDMSFSSWLNNGTRIDIDKYRISVDPIQLQEMIDYLEFLILEADQQKTKDQIRQLAAFLRDQQAG